MATVNEFAKLVVNVDSTQLQNLKKDFESVLTQAKSFTNHVSDIKVGIDSSKALQSISDLKKQLIDLNSTKIIIPTISASAGIPQSSGSNATRTSGSKTQLSANAAEYNSLTKAAKAAEQQIAKYNAEARALSSVSFERSIKGVATEFNFLYKSIRYATAALSVGFGFAEIAKISDSWTNLGNRLKLVTKDQDETTVAMENVYDIAQKTSQSLDTVAVLYQKLTPAGKQLNKTQSEIAATTETVARAVQISGSTAESAKAAIYQLSQGLASGTLRGQEFNSVNEQANGIIQALAVGLGKTTDQVRELAFAGGLTTSVFFKAIEAAKEWIDVQAQTQTKTMSQGIQEIDNAFTKLIGTFAQTTDASNKVYAALHSISNTLDSVATTGLDTFISTIEVLAGLLVGRLAAALFNNIASFIALHVQIAANNKALIQNAIATEEAAKMQVIHAKAANNIAKAEAAAAFQEVREAESLELLTGATTRAVIAKERLAVANAAVTQSTATLATAEAASVVAGQKVVEKTKEVTTATKGVISAIGSGLLSLVGGWTGLGLTIAAVGAWWLLTGDEAESSAEKQKAAAEKMNESIKKTLSSTGLKNVEDASYSELTTASDKLETDLKETNKKLIEIKKQKIALDKEMEGLKSSSNYQAAFEESSKNTTQASGNEQLRTYQQIKTEIDETTSKLKEQEKQYASLTGALNAINKQKKNEAFEEERNTEKVIADLNKRLEKQRTLTNVERVTQALKTKGITDELASRRALEAASKADRTLTLDKQIKSVEKLAKDINDLKIKKTSVNKVEEYSQRLQDLGIASESEYGKAILRRAKVIDEATEKQKQLNTLEEDAKALVKEREKTEISYTQAIIELKDEYANKESSLAKAQAYEAQAQKALLKGNYELARKLADQSLNVIKDLSKSKELDNTGKIDKQTSSFYSFIKSLEKTTDKEVALNNVEKARNLLTDLGISKTSKLGQAILSKSRALDEAIKLQARANTLEQKSAALMQNSIEIDKKYAKAKAEIGDKYGSEDSSKAKAEYYQSEARKAISGGDTEGARTFIEKGLSTVSDLKKAGEASNSSLNSLLDTFKKLDIAADEFDKSKTASELEDVNQQLKQVDKNSNIDLNFKLSSDAIKQINDGASTVGSALEAAFTNTVPKITTATLSAFAEGLKGLSLASIDKQADSVNKGIDKIKAEITDLQKQAEKPLEFKISEGSVQDIISFKKTFNDALDEMIISASKKLSEGALKFGISPEIDSSNIEGILNKLGASKTALPVTPTLQDGAIEAIKKQINELNSVITLTPVIDTSSLKMPASSASSESSSVYQSASPDTSTTIGSPEITGYATGGYVKGKGTETSDSILTRLSNKEYVINAAATKSVGTSFLDKVNKGEIPKTLSGQNLGNVTINLDNGKQVALSATQDQFSALLRKTAIKHGRTRTA